MNCKGEGNKSFFRVCNNNSQEIAHHIFIIMETRTGLGKLNKDFKQLGLTGYEFSRVKGFAGGISIGWKFEKCKITIIVNHFQSIHSKINTTDRNEWLLTMVYVIPKEEGKKELWKELKEITTIIDI